MVPRYCLVYFPQFLLEIILTNFSLGFRVGNVCDNGSFDIVDLVCPIVFFSLNFNLKSINTLSLGFRVGKFRDSGPFNIIYSI